MYSFHFVTITNGEKTFIANRAALEMVNVEDAAQAKKVFGETAQWIEVNLHPATFGRQQEIRKKCLIRGAQGLEADETLSTGARVAVMVDGWSYRMKPSADALEELSAVEVNTIDAEILAYLYPVITEQPDFLAVLAGKSKSSNKGE